MVGVPGLWRRRQLVTAGMMVALMFSATIVYGQIELASVQGTVKDEEGNPLEGVEVILRDAERGRLIEMKTDKNGRFFRRGMRATEYEMTVQKEGYQSIQDKLPLSAGLEKRFDFKLAKGSPVGAEEFVRGVEAFNRGDNQAAALAFEEAVKKAPEAPEIRVNLALAYLRLSRIEDATAQFEKAAAMAPDSPRVLFQLGAAYVEAKKNDQAIAALEKGLTLQPVLTDELAYEATVTLGAVYFATGQNDQAIARFEKAIAAKPDAPTPKLGLAKALFSKGEADKALEYFKQVVSSAPGTPEAAEADAFIKELEKAKTPGAA